ncbi:hypothetical protein PAK_P30079 [Pseudomonas phage PAK_P3]|uniref:Uncharacterized protein n=2 Tax=Nankokuvirus PAKP3 TaxID=1925782 RepID=F2W671_9CAUD|nr:hypothetical protein PAK_P30079 [Pseudomonas phage PAK_P3]ADX32091.1 hypothetical protein P3_CHA0079 [Pseudomonas phage P3_CHA]ADX32276.1 hypothetical protein PAK_P30079 [Pseudomonas phage PAK_P3]
MNKAQLLKDQLVAALRCDDHTLQGIVSSVVFGPVQGVEPGGVAIRGPGLLSDHRELVRLANRVWMNISYRRAGLVSDLAGFTRSVVDVMILKDRYHGLTGLRSVTLPGRESALAIDCALLKKQFEVIVEIPYQYEGWATDLVRAGEIPEGVTIVSSGV